MIADLFGRFYVSRKTYVFRLATAGLGTNLYVTFKGWIKSVLNILQDITSYSRYMNLHYIIVNISLGQKTSRYILKAIKQGKKFHFWRIAIAILLPERNVQAATVQ